MIYINNSITVEICITMMFIILIRKNVESKVCIALIMAYDVHLPCFKKGSCQESYITLISV